MDEPEPIRIGLVGAGQWAADMHAPLHAAPGPTTLAGVWARDPAQAERLARAHGAEPFAELDAMLREVDAVDFAVPPAAQAALGVRAADAGKPLMLEKPLAADVGGAARLVEAVAANRVPTLLALTRRYDDRVDGFLDEARAARASGLVAISAAFAHGGLLPDGFIGARERQGWRSRLGVLADLGPHLIDLVDASGGPVTHVGAVETPGEAVAVTTRHAGGALGQLLLSSRVRGDGSLFTVRLLGHGAGVSYDGSGLDVPRLRARMRGEFARAARGGLPATVDAARGLRVQQLLEAAGDSLRRGGALIGVPGTSDFEKH